MKIITFPNAIVRVHFPDISDEEQARRMKYIRKAAEEVIKESIRRKTENGKT